MKLIKPDDFLSAGEPAQFKPPQILSVKELVSELVAAHLGDPNSTFGFPTSNWPVFNESFGGARPGELTVITAETGVGKTTFAINWLLDHCKQKRNGLIVSLEIGTRGLAKTIAQMVHGKSLKHFEDSDITAVGAILETLPLWWLDWTGMIRLEWLLAAIDHAADHFGINFIVIDHLDYIIKPATWSSNESTVVGDCMRMLAGKAKEKNVSLVLIAHPAKLNQQGIKRREVGLDELKGSSSIKQEADNVFGIHRPEDQKNVTQLRFLKIRDHEYGKNLHGKIMFTYNPASLQLIETSTELEWEK